MDRFHVQGPTKPQGEVITSGARNTALSILFAALLTEEPVEIQNIPKLKDVNTSMRLLSQPGAKVERNGSVHIDACNMNAFCAPYDLVKAICVSTWVLRPSAACFGQGRVSLPGGCTTGACPAGLHITGLEQLGATIKLEEGYVKAFIDGRLRGAYIVMDKVNVGVMATIMYAVTPAGGTTVIESAAHEPEIVDAASFLIALDAKIAGQGTDRITIEGAERLGGGAYRVLPDRTETDTFLAVATVFRGRITCRSAQPDTLDAVLARLRDAGADIEVGDGWISLDMHGKRPKVVNVCTAPHPAFPIDIQAQFTLLSLVTEGTGFITETVFGNRFMRVLGLSCMGAHAEIESNIVIYHGVETLSGAQIMVTDLRASASLVLVGCVAGGTTVVGRIHHIDRSHECIEDKLHVLSADIERVKGE